MIEAYGLSHTNLSPSDCFVFAFSLKLSFSTILGHRNISTVCICQVNCKERLAKYENMVNKKPRLLAPLTDSILTYYCM